MARKLGIAVEGKSESGRGNTKGEEKVEIDEELAVSNIQKMINIQRSALNEFDKESQFLRVTHGGDEGKVLPLKQIGQNDLLTLIPQKENERASEEKTNEEKKQNSSAFSEGNIYDNPDSQHSQILHPPKTFHGILKPYQLKGLRWLDNLYEQGINGILADEMVHILPF
jgi:SNF2 family DNA or RNA helicase